MALAFVVAESATSHSSIPLFAEMHPTRSTGVGQTMAATLSRKNALSIPMAMVLVTTKMHFLTILMNGMTTMAMVMATMVIGLLMMEHSGTIPMVMGTVTIQPEAMVTNIQTII